MISEQNLGKGLTVLNLHPTGQMLTVLDTTSSEASGPSEASEYNGEISGRKPPLYPRRKRNGKYCGRQRRQRIMRCRKWRRRSEESEDVLGDFWKGACDVLGAVVNWVVDTTCKVFVCEYMEILEQRIEFNNRKRVLGVSGGCHLAA